jgi:hypothetical protein
MSTWKRHGYGLVIGSFLVISLALFLIFGWFVYVDEQLAHGEPVDVAQYVKLMIRDGNENLVSEWAQLLGQVVLLRYLLYVGSPQSKEASDRVEAKLDIVLHALDRGYVIEQLDLRYPRR